MILLYGSDSCLTSAAVKHSFEFTLNKVLFKFLVLYPKTFIEISVNILV